jgi:hypothetical protein
MIIVNTFVDAHVEQLSRAAGPQGAEAAWYSTDAVYLRTARLAFLPARTASTEVDFDYAAG